MKSTIKNGVAAFALMTGAMLASPSFTLAYAQDAGPDSEPSEQAAAIRRADTIIVTAQRRTQTLQDVPVTVTAFGAELIEDARIQQIDDIVNRTPGLSFDAFPASQPRLYIRGIGSSDRGAAGDPSSAVFIDDIYMGRPAAIAFDAFDVERIEVLKGPQGTLYGRNVVGGAINVITQRPELDAFDASVSATVGNYGRLDGAGYLNLPFAGDHAVRISASRRSHDGYVENPYLGQDVDDEETTSGRIQYYGEPTSDMRIHLTLDGTRDRSTGSANHVLELDASDPLSNFYSQNFDPDVTYGSDPGYMERDTYGVRAEIANDFNFGTLTVLASYRDLDYSFGYDFDGGNPDPTSPGFNAVSIAGGNDETAELSSQEVRLSSLPDSSVDWVVGVYHYNQEVQRSDTLVLDSFLIAPIPLTEVYYADATLDSYAVFGDATYPISDRLAVFGGLRYSMDDKTQRVSNSESDAPLRGDELFDVTASVDFDAWTFRAGMEFRPTDDDLFYGTISRGYKSGGLNDLPVDAEDAARPFGSETATQYEVGQKSAFFDGAMIWNNTLYYMDYSDLQTGQTVDGRNIVTNAGKAHIQGYETQMSVNPVAGLNLTLAYAYTDAIFDEFVEGGVDLSGNRISRSPEHEVSVGGSYVFPVSSKADLTFAAEYRYASEIFDDNNNRPPEYREPTSFLDARVILDVPDNGLSVSLWGKNLTDERTRTFQGGFLGANFGAFSPPRTYGLTLTWSR